MWRWRQAIEYKLEVSSWRLDDDENETDPCVDGGSAVCDGFWCGLVPDVQGSWQNHLCQQACSRRAGGSDQPEHRQSVQDEDRQEWRVLVHRREFRPIQHGRSWPERGKAL